MSARPHLSEEGSDLDRKFFAANPNRKHRVRGATADEVAIFERHGRRLLASEFLFLAIRQYAPGMRLRYWIPAIPCGALPGGEDNARLIFEARAAGKSGFVALDPSEAADVQP
jgi:hypothetical protein